MKVTANFFATCLCIASLLGLAMFYSSNQSEFESGLFNNHRQQVEVEK